MHALAIAYLILWVAQWLPGSAFLGARPKLNWKGSPHPYLALVRLGVAPALAVLVLR